MISICLFFAVFCGALVWAFCLKKPFVNQMGALPLDDSPAAPAATVKGEDCHE